MLVQSSRLGEFGGPRNVLQYLPRHAVIASAFLRDG